MDNSQDKGEKRLSAHNQKEEKQIVNKQMLGFEEVNFEQRREPYRGTPSISRNPEGADRRTENRK
jgi:hypothetical protein